MNNKKGTLTYNIRVPVFFWLLDIVASKLNYFFSKTLIKIANKNKVLDMTIRLNVFIPSNTYGRPIENLDIAATTKIKNPRATKILANFSIIPPCAEAHTT